MRHWPQGGESVKNIMALFTLFAIACATLAPLIAEEGRWQPGGLLNELFILKNHTTSRISSFDKSGGNEDWLSIGPGETKVLAEIPGAAVIRRFYVVPYALDRMRYRKAVLRMYWDGQKEPCVEVPIGDFFGSGLGALRFFGSLVVNVNPGWSTWDIPGMASYFPMPFERGARITMENDGAIADL